MSVIGHVVITDTQGGVTPIPCFSEQGIDNLVRQFSGDPQIKIIEVQRIVKTLVWSAP